MFNDKKFAVLTYGRSGSNLLVANLGYALNVYPRFVHEQEQLDYSSEVPQVLHSHLLFDNKQLSNYVCIFNLRLDPVQTILSMALSDFFQHWHQFTTQTRPVMEKVCINDKNLHYHCSAYIKWHNHYSKHVHDDSYVIIYEDLIKFIRNPNKTYVPTYPNKHQLISNYDDCVSFLNKRYRTLLEDVGAKFYKHVNPYNIYQLLDV